ncbi:unnamed protein product [Ectocarpus fasciculatus]
MRVCTPYKKKRGTSLETAGTTKLGTRHGGSKDMVIKRCRFSSSPATGLVGMQENVFLSNFFGSVGFLPLATRRDVREVMVTLMMSPTRPQSTVTRDCDVENKFDAIVSEDKVVNTWEGDDLPKTCTFWCAVAIGALAKGHPIESTTSYFLLAKEALARYSGPTNFGLAKAWTILAYLHGFVGDMDGFYEYLARSDSFVRDSEQSGSRDSLPVGFPEVVKHGETIKLFTGAADAEEVESLLAQEVSFPKMCVVASEEQVCRYVMQYHRAVEVGIQQAVRPPGDTTYVGADDAEHTDDGARSDVGDAIGGTCSPYRFPKCSDMGFSGFSGWNGMPVPVAAFHLEDAVERTSIRAGFGGLIINATLFFERVLEGNIKGALERIGRCVEVFEGFPGIARFGMGKHMAHIMLSMAASLDDARDGGLYDRLRNACNLTRPPGSLAFPPLEEWQGISAFCDNPACRSTEALFAERNVDLSSLHSFEGIKAIREESSDSTGSLKGHQASPTTPSACSPSVIDTIPAVVGEASPPGCHGAMHTLSEDDDSQAEAKVSQCRVEMVVDAEGLPCSAEGVQREESFANSTAQAAEVLHSSLHPSNAIDEEAQDHVIAAEDWFDVISAMGASTDTDNGT